MGKMRVVRGTRLMAIQVRENEVEVDAKAFGKALSRLRVAAGFDSPEALAKEIAYHPDYIRKMENGKRVPSPELIVLLETKLNVQPGQLFGELHDRKEGRELRWTQLPEGLSEEDTLLILTLAYRLARQEVPDRYKEGWNRVNERLEELHKNEDDKGEEPTGT